MNILWCADTLQKYIENIPSAVGIIHSENLTHSAHIAECLLMNDAVGIRSWWTALAKLSEGETAFLIVEEQLSDEFQTIIQQLNDKSSRVEVYDRRLCEAVSIEMPRTHGKLLLIGHREKVMKLPFVDGEDILRDFFEDLNLTHR